MLRYILIIYQSIYQFDSKGAGMYVCIYVCMYQLNIVDSKGVIMLCVS